MSRTTQNALTALVLLSLFAVAFLMWGNAVTECNSRKGVMVKTTYGYECVEKAR
jgi:hypothetical protein